MIFTIFVYTCRCGFILTLSLSEGICEISRASGGDVPIFKRGIVKRK